MIKALFRGIADGWTQPHEFSVGMSYEDGTRYGDAKQVTYDYASILGQDAARKAQTIARKVLKSTGANA